MNHCSEEDVGTGSGNHRLLCPHEISSFMPCELTWSNPTNLRRPWVFWSKSNDEFQRFQSLFSNSAETFRGSGTIKEKIKYSLQRITIKGSCCLVQFWAPVIIGDRKYLTTSDQPFALGELVEGLCSYRKHCLDYLIPVDEMSAEGGNLCPPGRVFRHGLPELSIDVHHYSFKEYPQRDAAVHFGVGFYSALPVFEPQAFTVVGVLEIVMDTKEGYFISTIQDNVFATIKEVDLKSSDMDRPIYMHSKKAIREIQKMLDVVLEKHELPCQTWVPTSDASGIGKVTRAEMCVGWWIYDHLYSFMSACKLCYIQKGQGVVGKAFLSNGACFCRNTSQLSISEYPLVSSARKVGLTGCFALCLRSTVTGDSVYILEFFLSLNQSDYDDPRTLVEMLMATMKQELKSFKVATGQELGEKLFVEVLKTSSADELDSFEIWKASGDRSVPTVSNLQDGGEFMQLGTVHQQADAITNADNIDVNGSCLNQVAASAPHTELQSVGGKFLPGSSHQQLITDLDVANRKRNIGSMEQFDIDSNDSGNRSTRKRIDREYGIKLEDLLQHSGKKLHEVANDLGGNDSGNRSTRKRIDKEYGITLEDLLQHSGKKLHEVANELGVSRSTLKRICRQHNIHRWPHCKAKNDNFSHLPREIVQPTEEHVGDSCPTQLPLSDHPVEQDNNSEPYTMPVAGRIQDDSNMIVKAKYKNEIIKFDLPISSRKEDLEAEVVKRLPLSIGSFNLKYLDEDKEWIKVACDGDLRMCISGLRSLGENTIRMKVNL